MVYRDYTERSRPACEFGPKKMETVASALCTEKDLVYQRLPSQTTQCTSTKGLMGLIWGYSGSSRVGESWSTHRKSHFGTLHGEKPPSS